jgi:hypothetical protein
VNAGIRPWYRSRLFWLGVPGLMFLVWISLFSGRSFFLTFGDSTNQFSCDVEAGRVMVFSGGPEERITTPLYFAYGEGPLAQRGIVELPPPLTWNEWKEATINQGVARVLNYREIKVALWLLLTAYLFVWQGLLLWWQRRKLRILTRPTSPPP